MDFFSIRQRGFALVISLVMMILLVIIAVGMLGLAAIELRTTAASDARPVAAANARVGLMLALGRLQSELGDDRRITADADILGSSENPHAVGVWDGWSPNLGARIQSAANPRLNYESQKQASFRSWLVSSTDPAATANLDWHRTAPPAGDGSARLFTRQTSGIDLSAQKLVVADGPNRGSLAWAVTQENTKARINIGTDNARRIDLADQMQTPPRPNLTLSAIFDHPETGWQRRPGNVISMAQAALDSDLGATRQTLSQAARDYTTDALSLLTNSVEGGLKADFSTGFDLAEADYEALTWDDAWGSVTNPFRGGGGRGGATRDYNGQKPIFSPLTPNAQVQVNMNFPPASVTSQFQINGVPTFDSLRAHYRIYRHMYNSGGSITAFERPQSHIATPRQSQVPGRPFGNKTQPAIMPVLNRLNFFISITGRENADGTITPALLFSPVVALWNPHNVAIETEGVVIYPWIDLAIFWNMNLRRRDGGTTGNWSTSLSRFVGEGYQGHGRSSRPYFYLHLTEDGRPVRPGSSVVDNVIRLLPGEVRTFALADTTARRLEPQNPAAGRTWRMKPVTNASDITNTLRGGIRLDLNNSIGGGSNFPHRLSPGDTIMGNNVEFHRGANDYYYIVGMADSWQIKNPTQELMVNSRPAGNGLPSLPETRDLVFYSQITCGPAHGQGRDAFSYPEVSYQQLQRGGAQLVGSLLTYHRPAMTGTVPIADMMFSVNPRQPYVNAFISNARFQTGPHYESRMQGGTSLASLAMETEISGRFRAFWGPSLSANKGRTALAFFEMPRSPTLSLGSFQHCDISYTAFGPAAQIGNSWASLYLPATGAAELVRTSPPGASITPGIAIYDHAYLANEVLFDGYFLSGAAPRFGSRRSLNGGSPAVYDADQISESTTTAQVLEAFFDNPVTNPLRNPRMKPYTGSLTREQVRERLAGPARAARLASHLMVEGGFNINSTSEEAWTAVLASLRGASPASANMTAQSRFRHIATGNSALIRENDDWSGFRTLSDEDVRTLATNLVAQVRERGPFLSLGEFVNRRVSTDRDFNTSGALHAAIDASGLNNARKYTRFDTTNFPHGGNMRNPNTGIGTPGWLTQADILHGLAPYITPRSDTFIIRSQGEARDAAGRVTATVMLEALVQRVPKWVDPADDSATPVADLSSTTNQRHGRRFDVISIRELRFDQDNNPI